MEDNTKHFETFSDNRLIEIVKNAKQFGYDDKIRNVALQVLKERGITEEDLRLTGNLTNYKYDYTRTLYSSYVINSRIAFVSYSALAILETIASFHLVDIDQFGLFPLLLLIVFFISLIRSFFDHINFYKSLGKELGWGDQIIFFIIGMPFYIFMYFFYKSQMKEEMRMVQ